MSRRNHLVAVVILVLHGEVVGIVHVRVLLLILLILKLLLVHLLRLRVGLRCGLARIRTGRLHVRGLLTRRLRRRLFLRRRSREGGPLRWSKIALLLRHRLLLLRRRARLLLVMLLVVLLHLLLLLHHIFLLLHHIFLMLFGRDRVRRL